MSKSNKTKTVIYRASVRVRIYNQLNRYSWIWTERTAYRDFIYDPRENPRCLEAWTEDLMSLENPNIDKILTLPEVEEIETPVPPKNLLQTFSRGGHVNHFSL